jgi:hypothetical protein
MHYGGYYFLTLLFLATEVTEDTELSGVVDKGADPRTFFNTILPQQ